jgi:hypothetical protein
VVHTIKTKTKDNRLHCILTATITTMVEQYGTRLTIQGESTPPEVSNQTTHIGDHVYRNANYPDRFVYREHEHIGTCYDLFKYVALYFPVYYPLLTF